MELVNSQDFGQIFITDTHRERILGILENLQAPFKSFEIIRGAVSGAGTVIKNVYLEQ
jgi:hypothetical protein